LVSFVVLFAFYRHADRQRRRAEAAHQRAEDQRLRAEMARREAEQNLDIASAVIGPLEEVVINAFHGKRVLGDDELHRIAALLRVEISKGRANPAFAPKLLSLLVNINWAIAGPLLSSGRLDEARLLARERIDLMRQCRERDPGNEDYLWQMAHALWSYGLVESASQRFDIALNSFDQATALTLGTVSASPTPRDYASYLFDAYHQLEDRVAPGENSEALKRAREGQLRLLPLFEPVISDRPDQLLFLACALADRGDWVRARGLVHTLAARNCPVPVQPMWLKQAAVRGLPEWFGREMRHWNCVVAGQEVGPETLDREADEMVRLLADLRQALGIPGELSPRELARMIDEFTARAAARQREEGQLPEAERTITAFLALAHQLVRKFPDQPDSHRLLLAAVIEQSKSAWRQNDIGAAERKLVQSVEVLQREMVLDHKENGVRRILQHYIAELTGELTTRAASQRKDGRLDEADRTVASLMAIAQRLAREFPTHPRAHVMLSEAFLQESKKGWRRNDLNAIKRCLNQSIEEAQRALALDPHDDWARRRFQDDRKKLAALPGS
jgi:hypothetical protein